MTDSAAPAPEATIADEAATGVSGGGPATPVTIDPVDQAVAHLELLSAEARDAVLAKMDPALAERIRNRMQSTPDRPHGEFSRDVVARRRMLREMTERIHATNAARQRQAADDSLQQAARPAAGGSAAAGAAMPVGASAVGGASATTTSALHGGAAPAMFAGAPAQPRFADPLDSLKVLHPAAIARAMQGERAEAWALVLDRLDINARAALQMYLDPAARAAIEDARARQAELAATAPQLVQTIEAAIARTVVPRAMREHHQLLSTTPLTWNA